MYIILAKFYMSCGRRCICRYFREVLLALVISYSV